MSLHEIHRGQAPLTDIVGRLRLLADQIESGKYKADLCCVVLKTPPIDDGSHFVHTFSYGDYKSVYECDGLMMYAATHSRDGD